MNRFSIEIDENDIDGVTSQLSDWVFTFKSSRLFNSSNTPNEIPHVVADSNSIEESGPSSKKKNLKRKMPTSSDEMNFDPINQES